MKIKIVKIAFEITILYVIITGCGDIKGTSYESAPAEGPNVTISQSIFPHKSYQGTAWKEQGGHGKWVLDYDIKACANPCHGTNFEGGSARSCKTCHESFPHPASEIWQGIEGHGKFAKDAGGTNVCATKCHSTDFTGGYDPKKKKSCAKCHTSYPIKHNDASWSSKNHGAFVKELGSSKECSTMCHRQDVPEGLKIKTCADCHPSYPKMHEDPNWGSAGKHKEFLSQYGDFTSSDCTTCHGEKLTGGSSEIACATSECHHKGGANIAGWKDKTEHGVIAASDISKCTACHEQGLKGNSVVVGCDTCHHKNWADTHEKPWANMSEHGAYGKDPATTCKVCHGAELDGGLSGIACSSCHGDIYPHSDNWKDKGKHGFVAKGDLNKCKSCHGEAIADCESCHHNSDNNWKKSSHQAIAKSDTSGCKACHGTDLKGGASGKSCYDCHDNDDDQYNGNNYPHPESWGEQYNHGSQYQLDSDSCKTACHGTDLKGGISGKKCNQCHTTYPHFASDWDETHGNGVLTSGKFDIGKFQNSGDSSCSNCHGGIYTHKKYEYPDNMTPEKLADLVLVTNPNTGDPANYRCYFCHFAFPHIEGVWKLNGASEPWKKVHGKVYSGNTWGAPSGMCGTSGGCHTGKPKVETYKSNSSDCKYCHKAKGS